MLVLSILFIITLIIELGCKLGRWIKNHQENLQTMMSTSFLVFQVFVHESLSPVNTVVFPELQNPLLKESLNLVLDLMVLFPLSL